MTTFLADARGTVAPRRESKDGLLPPLLVALTVVTGLVDSFSYLVLGHVFVANQTGNVVFFAFALAGVAVAALAWAKNPEPIPRLRRRTRCALLPCRPTR
jgi:hypothetical protein